MAQKVGLEPKEGETGENFGRRVRKEEEKQGKRTKKKKEKPTNPAEGNSNSSAEASAKASVNSGYVHKLGTLTEVLLGPPAISRSDIADSDDTQVNRWARLAGLLEKD